MKLSTQEFIDFCKYQHDIECNQKYDKIHPYSFHLDLVYKQAMLFKHLIPEDEPYHSSVICAIYAHDLIEDGRCVYSDLLKQSNKIVADIVYACTDEKGRNRKERHSDAFFELLKQNDLAVFVKLCDIMANTKYSLLTNSTMLDSYRGDFQKVKTELYRDEYKEMFDYLEKLITIHI